MLLVSDNATERLAQMLDNANAQEGVAARLVTNGEDGITMQPSKQEAGDTTFEHDGRVVLVIDKDTAEAINDYVLDVADDGSGLSLQPSVQ